MLLILAFSIPSAAAADLEVGPGHTYSTITDGINAASAGDNIKVYDNGGTPYVYTENVVMNKENLTLQGWGNVTIQAATTDTPVVSTTKGSVLKNFTILGINNQTWGVLVNYDSTILNNKISNNRYGIRSPAESSANIINNTVAGNDYGIWVDGGDALITGNTIANNNKGILSQTMKYLTVTGNIITNNQEAILIDGNAHTTITQNQIKNNQAGINILQAQSVQVHFNRITNNTNYGLYNELTPGVTFDLPYNGIVYAQYNWWGYNDQLHVQSQIKNIGAGTVIYKPWLVLRIIIIKNVVYLGQRLFINADLTQDSDGVVHDPRRGHIPDGVGVFFQSTRGSVGSNSVTKYTLNGVATAIFTADQGTGTGTVRVSLDGQDPLGLSIDIQPAPTVNAATSTRTVGMQNTGAPLAPLALAIISLLGGIAATMKR